MNSELTNKIDAQSCSLYEILHDKKYTVDYFQREYSWGKNQIEQLVTDLTSSFLNEYGAEDENTEIEGYNNYYLGSLVLMKKGGNYSIIDGQQRLTSLTLFLIYQGKIIL